MAFPVTLEEASRPSISRAPPHPKRSFLRLPVDVDVEALLAEFRSIPPDAWGVSHWDIHGSSSMLLLRGGRRGTEEDFVTAEVGDAPILATLPYIGWLLGAGGPFGQPTYAFLFRMKPMGVARPHTDDQPAWRDPFRLHVPITTNDGAYLLSEGRAKHLPVGEVWTFDNQALHAAVNGAAVRTHLIFDVPPNPRLDALLARARWDPGIEDPALWERASGLLARPILAPLRSVPLARAEKARLGLAPDGFACRISQRRWVGRLTLAPGRVGDVLHSVDGVEECALVRTATDYIQLCHQPGETVRLGPLRDGARLTRPLRLHRNFLPAALRRGLWRVVNAVGRG